ncbi:MAG: hypothetical protein BHV68_02635 [Bacteroidales bacterium 43_8]|nr:MAG: hypothetical protein BHV68_02635 [Bacteroidales bacterium 43_8]
MKFEIMDNSCTFVMKLRQSFDITISVGGIFCTIIVAIIYKKDIAVGFPSRAATEICCSRDFGEFWEANGFFINQISSNMPKSHEICNGVKYSNTRTRVPQRNEGKLLSKIKELQKQLDQMTQKFEIEKNCKNQAYYWILSSGNFKRFAEYCKKHPATLDYHGACLAQLYLDSLTNKKY